MARTREFDPKEALNEAMLVFWRKGYADTSIEDLVSATGVNRYGLYDAFGSKHGLFLAALDHYQRTIVESLFAAVERPDASISEIRAYFAKLAEIASTEAGHFGCLMSSTANEVAPHDKDSARKVEQFRSRLRGGFKTALSHAKNAQELGPQFNVERAADFLTGIVQGVPLLVRSHAEPRMIQNVIETALSCLR